ncbi:MAG TPA: hypothetical protein PKC76_16380 [Saprospiraceae bacterium]|nr:hypothetical protein [Saprospiraceae bacterium]HMP25710.1 hypothetical protein [Saprospiraceae bacterium]
MKQYLLFLLLCIAMPTIASAQLAKGNWMLGGSFYLSNDFGDAKRFIYTVSPYAGYLLSNRFMLGMGLSSTGFQNVDDVEVFDYAVQPFVRYYFPMRNPKFAWLLQAGGAYEWGRFDSPLLSEPLVQTTWRANAGGGLNIFVTPGFAVELGWNFDYINDNFGTPRIESTFVGGLQLYIAKNTEETAKPVTSEAIRQQTAIIGVRRNLIGTFSEAFESLALLMLNDQIALGGGLRSPVVTIDATEGIRLSEIRALLPVFRVFPDINRNGRFGPYFGAGTDFTWFRRSTNNNDFSLNPFVDAGILYFITSRLALDGNFRYRFNAIGNNETRLSEPGFSMGFQYLIPSKN